MKKTKRRRLWLFNGFTAFSRNDLYRVHIQIGPLVLCVESAELYRLTREYRALEKVTEK